MAGISTGQSEGGKRSVDHEIPLIPFIDLLLCCVMFLLVTAVWNKLASLDANLESPGEADMERVRDDIPLTVQISANGYVVASPAGDYVRIPRAGEEGYDVLALEEHLAARHRMAPNARGAVVSADDGVQYAELVKAMDVLHGTGFDAVTVTGSL
jgi:biopolymer transport protein ExbD